MHPILSQLGLSHPIIQAGMAGGPTTPELVAAVCNAGGMGTLGAGYLRPDEILQAVGKIRVYTTRPFAVNLFVEANPHVEDSVIHRMQNHLNRIRQTLGIPVQEGNLNPSTISFSAQFEAVLKAKPAVLSTTFGVLDQESMHRLKESGIIIIGTATTVAEAILLEESGVDAVVAQGVEAGGHRGTFLGNFRTSQIGTFTLVPQVCDHVTCPVIAAGGIMDGRGIAASFALGAIAVQMGTAFLTTIEAGTRQVYREAILESRDESTVLTKSFSGKFARGLDNQWIRTFEETIPPEDVPAYPVQHYLTLDIRQAASSRKDTQMMSMWAGQGSGMARVCKVSELMEALIVQYELVRKGL